MGKDNFYRGFQKCLLNHFQGRTSSEDIVQYQEHNSTYTAWSKNLSFIFCTFAQTFVTNNPWTNQTKTEKSSTR